MKLRRKKHHRHRKKMIFVQKKMKIFNLKNASRCPELFLCREWEEKPEDERRKRNCESFEWSRQQLRLSFPVWNFTRFLKMKMTSWSDLKECLRRLCVFKLREFFGFRKATFCGIAWELFFAAAASAVALADARLLACLVFLRPSAQPSQKFVKCEEK